MLVLKSNIPVVIEIPYDVVALDNKTAGDIDGGKFFLALNREDQDNVYAQIDWGSGLAYDDPNKRFEVTINQGDLDNVPETSGLFVPVLAFTYTGDTEFREPELIELDADSNEIGPLRVQVIKHYSTP